jgi:hypothetical protein
MNTMQQTPKGWYYSISPYKPARKFQSHIIFSVTDLFGTVLLAITTTKLSFMKRDPFATDGSADLGEQYKDERTEKKIHEHLNNEKDIITEEDIANAPAGPVNKNPAETVGIPEATKEDTSNGEQKIEEEKIKDNTDPGIGTSWNVLES